MTSKTTRKGWRRLVCLTALLLLCVSGLPPAGARAEEVTEQPITLTLAVGIRGGTYSGTLEDGLPHGVGVFRSAGPDGLAWYYQGAFVRGHFEGEGVLEFANGQRQEGIFARDRLNGAGRVYDGERLMQEGVFRDGELYTGRYADEEGSWYEMKDGKQVLNWWVLWVFGGVLLVFIVGMIFMARFFKKGAAAVVKTYVTARYPAQQPPPPAKRAVVCGSCGAGGEVTEGVVSYCAYCGMPLA